MKNSPKRGEFKISPRPGTMKTSPRPDAMKTSPRLGAMKISPRPAMKFSAGSVNSSNDLIKKNKGRLSLVNQSKD